MAFMLDSMLRKAILVIVLASLTIFFLLGFWWVWRKDGVRFLSPVMPGNFKIERPMIKYSFENLSQRQYQGSEIKLERVLKEEKEFTSWLFSFQSDGKRATGMANLPQVQCHPERSEGSHGDPSSPLDSLEAPQDDASCSRATFPVIVMLRGYADDEIYFTGLGTRKAAAVFAENGFVTLAPDFLGFGESDPPSGDILEARFERPVMVLNLLASIKTLSEVDPNKVFLWAHSNGGQIALSVLEVSSLNVPTALWAPVTKGFPESVLDYIGDPLAGGDDQGKKVIDRIFEFEKYHDSKEFSIDTHFDRIQAPLQIQQGGGDYLVEQAWTNEFVEKMRNLSKDITYYTYSNADHNLKQNWDMAVARDLEFFRKFLE